MSAAFATLAAALVLIVAVLLLWWALLSLIDALSCDDDGPRHYRGKRSFRPDRRWFT